MSNQPDLESLQATIPPVINKEYLRPVLWANLEALMTHRWGAPNEAELARLADVGAATVNRLKNLSNSTGIDNLVGLAHAFGLQPWQLLIPDLKPEALPRLDGSPYSPQASDLAKSLDRIKDPVQRQRAYATAMAVLSLVESSQDGAPGAPLPPGP